MLIYELEFQIAGNCEKKTGITGVWPSNVAYKFPQMYKTTSLKCIKINHDCINHPQRYNVQCTMYNV